MKIFLLELYLATVVFLKTVVTSESNSNTDASYKYGSYKYGFYKYGTNKYGSYYYAGSYKYQRVASPVQQPTTSSVVTSPDTVKVGDELVAAGGEFSTEESKEFNIKEAPDSVV